MATLKVLGSGSSGNSYILQTKKENLILELGCKWNEVLGMLNYKIDNVCGCLVTHEHQDHAKYIPNALKYQLPVYSCQDVADKYKGVKVLHPRKRYKIGGFIVTPLPVEHNVENYAYIIEHEEIGKLVFATDLTHFPYKVKGVNHFMIEANNSENLIIDHLCDNEEIRSHSEFHMELNNTLDAIRNNVSEALNSLILVHLSAGQSDERMFKQRVFEEFGVMPYVADKGVEIPLDKLDF